MQFIKIFFQNTLEKVKYFFEVETFCRTNFARKRKKMQQLDAYLDSPPPGYALLLAGAWGVGKSFFWNRYSNELDQNKLTPITFSASGLQTIEDLERSFFQASIVGLGGPATREAGAVIGRAILRLVKIDPDDIKFKADVTGGKTVVCIDDIERFSGDFEVLFGFIVSLIDGNALHCILIANETKAQGKPQYNEYKERIIGKTIHLEPDVRSFCESTINGFVSEVSRKQLLEHLDLIVSIAESREVRNLRTLRFLLTEANGIISSIPNVELRKNGISLLLEALSFYVIATARSADNLNLVFKVFSTSDLGIVLSMNDSKSNVDKEETEFSLLCKLLKETKFFEASYNWPQSHAFANLVKGKFINFDELARDFEIIVEMNTGKEDSLKVVNKYRELSDIELQKHINILVDEIVNHQNTVLGRIFDIYHVLHWLAKKGLFYMSPEMWTEVTLKALSEQDIGSFSSDEVDFWMGPYDANDQLVIKSIKNISQSVKEVEKNKQSEVDRNEIISGADALPEALDRSIFSETDPNAYFAKLQVGGQRSSRRMQQFFLRRMNVSNSPDFVGDDGTFANSLAGIIESNVPFQPPMTIASSSMRELAKTLRDFATFVDTYRSS